VVSYGPASALAPLLASAALQTEPVQVRIWHNGPGPLEEVAALPEARAVSAVVLGGAGNLGFGAGINRLLRAAAEAGGPELAVVANPDLVLAPDCVERLCEPFAHAQVVVAGGALSSGSGAQVNAFRLQLTLDLVGINADRGGPLASLGPDTGHIPEPDGPDMADYLGPSGALFAVHRGRHAAQVGGPLFCEPLFLYLEDVALWIRLRRHHAGIAFAPRAQAEHAFSQSTGQRSALKLYYVERNRLWLLRALHGTARAAALLPFTALRYGSYLLAGLGAPAAPGGPSAAALARAFREALRDGLTGPLPAALRDYLSGGRPVSLSPYRATLAAQLKNPVG
jgi:GT2 family glycosyltransferase